MDTNYLIFAASKIGISGIAAATGKTYHAARKWVMQGRLPRSEWTGETEYAIKIAAACTEAGFPTTRDQLLTLPSKEAAA